MVGNNPRLADGGDLAGMSTPLDTYLLNFINHHDIKKVSEIIATLGDCTKYETREAFKKVRFHLTKNYYLRRSIEYFIFVSSCWLQITCSYLLRDVKSIHHEII